MSSLHIFTSFYCHALLTPKRWQIRHLAVISIQQIVALPVYQCARRNTCWGNHPGDTQEAGWTDEELWEAEGETGEDVDWKIKVLQTL